MIYLSYTLPNGVPVVEKFESYDEDALTFTALRQLEELIYNGIAVTVVCRDKPA